MNEKGLLSYRLYFTAAVTIVNWASLLWKHFHGGVPAHHLLHRQDMPQISDWWSGLLIPLLTLFLTYRIQIRLSRNEDYLKFSTVALYPFLSALFYGILLSLTFSMGYSSITGYLFVGILLLSLFFPVYQAAYLLGFVLGMTITFGAVISTLAGVIFAVIGFILYLYVRAAVIFLINKARL